MKVQCPKCEVGYKIDENKVPAKGAYARCRKCQHRFFIKKEKPAEAVGKALPKPGGMRMTVDPFDYVNEIMSIAKGVNYDLTYNDKLRFDGNQPQISIGTPTKTPGRLNKGFFWVYPHTMIMKFWLPEEVDIDALSDQFCITIKKVITTHLKGLPPKMLFAQVDLKELELNDPNHKNFIKHVINVRTLKNRNIHKREPKNRPGAAYIKPPWILPLIENIKALKKDSDHQERAHESLVETFYELLGYKKFEEIRHRQGRIDIGIYYQGSPIIVNEVKRDWRLTHEYQHVVEQGYGYARQIDAKYVVITNGDYYALFNMSEELGYDKDFVGDFRVTRLKRNDLELINLLKKDNMPYNY